MKEVVKVIRSIPAAGLDLVIHICGEAVSAGRGGRYHYHYLDLQHALERVGDTQPWQRAVVAVW